ncbi:uncharacterized protein C630.12-like isoform X1 [Chenopodium quinoa]|uniref:uncharacterized protein C630.12-like isoform X1 n=1 Tax=Chenopodium quinoa TaxID=63459 RepID=UPI000B79658B|nr:uncharacterized protein C630.12-like isoform X1 [Chenopodium quinoa]
MVMMREKTWKLSLFFCMIWTITILYGEMFAYWVPFLWSYSWPHHSSSSLGGAIPSEFVKVAVITDPQLMDRTSHDFGPKSVALEIATFYSDLYMRRAFLSSILPFKPDAILFLGDYFDGGPRLSNKEWQESLSRFKHIFDLGKHGRTKDIPLYYIPGNHDIGYAGHLFHKPEIIERYEGIFGKRNYNFTIGKVDFVAIDAQTIDGDIKDNTTSFTWSFVDGFSMGGRTNPRVLLTHIPLYRPDWTPCGPYRSSEVINQRISRSAYDQRILYQNYVTKESSEHILDSIQPVLVLSGHDHEQCTVNHDTKYGTVKEHTLGTVSWQQGNFYPSFMLLSVGNFTHTNGSSQEPIILSQLCFLPTQLFIYIWYIILFVITILALSILPTHDINLHFGNLMTKINKLVREDLFSSSRKEKNEDENCEYEMMWDAEGSLHVIKKHSKAPLVVSKETSSTERGNAVMRAARKQMVLEQEGATKVDISGDPGSDVKNLTRSSKSLMRLMLQRCILVLGMVLVIAVVNVPLYMMLLFKDWAEQ